MRHILEEGERIYSKPFACLVNVNGASKKDFEKFYHMGDILTVLEQKERGSSNGYVMEGNRDWMTIDNELDFNKKV